MREYNHLDVSIQDDVFRIAFDRPEVKNAINQDVQREFSNVWQDAQESDTRIVLVTGNGDAFCAGGDASAMKRAVDDGAGRDKGPSMPALKDSTFAEAVYMIEKTLDGMIALQKPLVAKVNGDATGFGGTIAMLCDIAIASEEARLGDPHVNVGISTPVGPMLWPLLTDFHTAKWYLMTGELLSASEAADIGLINEAVPHDELDDVVDDRVDRLASGPQHAIRYTKMAMNNWLRWAANNMLRESIILEGVSQGEADHHEAAEAFMENRDPDFPSGRSQ
jgi:enoyl-CoA hydratase